MMKIFLIKLHWLISSQFGLDPRRFLRSLRGLPRFLKDWLQFCQVYTGAQVWMPCLHDRYEEGGATKSECSMSDRSPRKYLAWHSNRPI
jgi:hypothetical protein